jgi:hypothetical protein
LAFVFFLPEVKLVEIPISQYLDFLRPTIPKDLISDASYSHIRNLASLVPGALAFSAFIFECRLGAREPAADVGVSLQKDNSGPEILSGKLPENDFDASLFSIPEWNRVRHFGKQWADPPSSLYGGIDDVWLEFDISAPGARGADTPSLFFSPFFNYHHHNQDPLSVEKGLRLLENIFLWVKGKSPGASVTQNWRKCLEMLPSLKQLFQVGLMLSRSDSDSLRMCIALDHGTFKRYLSNIHWPGDLAKLDPVLNKLATLFERLYLHIDVGRAISGKIGIECKFPKRKGPSREPRWYPFLDYLVEKGLCLPSKRDGLLAFPGYQKTDINACPRPLQELAGRLILSYSSFFVRTVYHVKLVYMETETWEAKGYFGINHLWKGLWGDNETGRGRWGIIG